MPRVPGQFALPRWIGMADDLIRISRTAINHRAIAVGLKLLARCVLSGTQRGEKLLFVPRPEQDVIAPLGVGVFDAVFSQLRPLLDCRRAGHVTKPARVRASDRDIEGPVRQTLVNEMVLRDDSGRVPEVHGRLLCAQTPAGPRLSKRIIHLRRLRQRVNQELDGRVHQ